MRRSFRVDQQVTLDVSESGVPVVNGNRSLVVAGLINQARRLCLSFLSELSPSQVSFYRGGRGRKELQAVRTCSGGGRNIIIYTIQTSPADARVGRRHRESSRGSPERRGTGPRTHRATTKHPPTLVWGEGVLEIQQDGTCAEQYV